MSNDAALFLRRFVANPQSIGAVAPSSPALAQAMLAPVDFDRARVIVELGPGTGALTASIIPRLTAQHHYLGVEIDADFCRILRGRYPHLEFAQSDAAALPELLAARGLDKADAVICGLPWAALPAPVRDAVMGAVVDALSETGVFVTFAYLQGLMLPGAWALRRFLNKRFGSVQTTQTVWRNLPPAFAYVCRQPRQSL